MKRLLTLPLAGLFAFTAIVFIWVGLDTAYSLSVPSYKLPRVIAGLQVAGSGITPFESDGALLTPLRGCLLFLWHG